MKIAVISSSLNPESRSRLLARVVSEKYASTDGVEVDLIDLQEHILPLSDGGAAYGADSVKAISARIEAADAYIIATPIYNYSINAALKNLIEFTGKNMEGKLVGFLVAAGGAMSYMAIMQFANSLMLDFRTLILPRFVYATGRDWEGDSLTEKLQERLVQFEEDFLKLATKLAD